MKTSLVIHSIGKQRNVDKLHSVSSAFELDQVIEIGHKKHDKMKLEQEAKEKRQEAQEEEEEEEETTELVNRKYPQKKVYRYFREFVEMKKNTGNSKKKKNILIGIEIGEPNSISVTNLHDYLFSRNRQEKEQEQEQEKKEREEEYGEVFLLPGNEGDGLQAKEKEVCDFFVFVPHSAVGSLNVVTATSIVLAELCRGRSRPGDDDDDDKNEKSSSTFFSSWTPVVLADCEVQEEEEENSSSSVHYLQRPASAFAADFLAVVSSLTKLKTKTLKSSAASRNVKAYARFMQKERQVEVESFCSVFQAVRDIRQRQQQLEENNNHNNNNNNSILIVGIVSEDKESVDLNSVLRRRKEISVVSEEKEEEEEEEQKAHKNNSCESHLVVVLGSPSMRKEDGFLELVLTESERKCCDILCHTHLLSNIHSALPLSCLLSILSYQVSSELGLFSSSSSSRQHQEEEEEQKEQQHANENNKLVVELLDSKKRQQEQQDHRESKSKERAQLRAKNNERLLKEEQEDDDCLSFF